MQLFLQLWSLCLWGAVHALRCAALVSSVVCLALYKLTRPLTYALFGTYRKLSHNDRRNWDSRCVQRCRVEQHPQGNAQHASAHADAWGCPLCATPHDWLCACVRRYSSNIHAVLCVYFAYYCVWDSDLFWKVGTLWGAAAAAECGEQQQQQQRVGSSSRSSVVGEQHHAVVRAAVGKAGRDALPVCRTALCALLLQADKTPQILRTSAQTYIGLGMSFGYFFIDFISCVKYMVRGCLSCAGLGAAAASLFVPRVNDAPPT